MDFASLVGFKGVPFYFNLTTPVGDGYPNARVEDVAFVQFGFVVAAAGKPSRPPDVQKEGVTGERHWADRRRDPGSDPRMARISPPAIRR
jgi:hypothetical protein